MWKCLKIFPVILEMGDNMLGIPSESVAKPVELSEKNRVDLCFGEIEDVCKKYRCQIMPVVSFIGASIEYGIKIIPLDGLFIPPQEVKT